MTVANFQLGAFQPLAFQVGVQVIANPAVWGAVSDYFHGHDRRMREARDEEARAEAMREAEAEVARIAAKAAQEAARARDLEEVIRRVDSSALAFRAFYLRLLDEQLAALRAREEAARLAREAEAARIEAERLAIAATVARLEAERLSLIQDDEDAFILMAAL